MAYFLNCEYDYKMRIIYNFNPELVQALGFGKQIHNIINLLHSEFESTKKVPTDKEITRIIENNFYMRYAADSLKEKLKESAKTSLLRYVELWKKDFSLSVKTERPFEYEFENSLIIGSIDMIKRKNGDSEILEIIDFKTGKPNNELKEKYALQVQLYSIAANEALGMNTKEAAIHFIDKEGNNRESIDTSPQALKSAKAKISGAIKGITKNQFKRTPSSTKVCQSCDWNKICPGKGK
ncbi:PD-(D/E)XK nuclease family protein [Leptospira levettii]|nr:PD-(D/E)XK nuclease family protein [Leptospira levettii]